MNVKLLDPRVIEIKSRGEEKSISCANITQAANLFGNINPNDVHIRDTGFALKAVKAGMEIKLSETGVLLSHASSYISLRFKGRLVLVDTRIDPHFV